MAETVQIEIPAPVQTIPVGFHAIMDCKDVDLNKIKDSTNIQNWINNVLTTLDSVASGAVNMTHSGFVSKNGYSALQLFNTGSLTVHIMEDLGHIYIDLFSWRAFNPDQIEGTIKTFFGSTTDVKKILIPRNASVVTPAAPAR